MKPGVVCTNRFRYLWHMAAYLLLRERVVVHAIILLLTVTVCSTVTRGLAQLLDKCGTNISLHAVLTVQCKAQKPDFMPQETVCHWLQEATAALQEEQRRKALEEEQKLAQERGPILGVRRLFTEQTLLDMLET